MIQAGDIRNISVIGAGLMGSGLALVFASSGYTVSLHDIDAELLAGAIENVRANLGLMAGEGMVRRQDIEAILNRINTSTELDKAVAGAHFVIEAVPENLELKQDVFRQLDALCPPQAILATNTSVISVTLIASTSVKRERIIGTHFWNPPYLIPLVEVIRGRDSSDEAVDTAYALMKKAGKHPVRVMKDVPGFIGNRLQHALWREAISIVQNGIADAASVDDVVKQGFGLRLPVLGPLENADMVGLDLTLSIHSYILKHLEASPEPSPLLREKVGRGEMGFKSGSGFYTWTDAEIKDARNNLNKYLMNNKRRSEI